MLSRLQPECQAADRRPPWGRRDTVGVGRWLSALDANSSFQTRARGGGANQPATAGKDTDDQTNRRIQALAGKSKLAVPRCFQWNAKCIFREGIAWFGRHRCAQPRQGRQVIAQRFIAGNDAPPESPSPARGERNPRAFAANDRRPSDDLLSSLRDFGPFCLRIPPLKGWASFYRPAGLAALFHRQQRRTKLAANRWNWAVTGLGSLPQAAPGDWPAAPGGSGGRARMFAPYRHPA